MTFLGRASNSEVWWDGLPWDMLGWQTDFEARFNRTLPCLIDPDSSHSPITGVTTNPRLVCASLNHLPGRINQLATECEPERLLEGFEAFWAYYRAIVRRNACLLLPLWERSAGRYGWFSAQLPPSVVSSVDDMVSLGASLGAEASNVMIKVPAHQHGIEAIGQLVSAGYSINATLVFTSAQVAACLEAISLALGSRRSGPVRQEIVVTFMIGRVGADAELQKQFAARGLDVSWQDLRQIELLACRVAHELVEASGLPVRLLVSSLKADFDADGRRSCAHFEGMASRRCILTVPAPLLEHLLQIRDLSGRVSRARHVSPPAHVTEISQTVPALRQTLEPDALAPSEFFMRPAFLEAFQEAALAHHRMMDLILRSRLTAAA